MDVVALFCVDDRDGYPAKKTECHEPLLAIGHAIVFVRVGNTRKRLFRVDKVESVLPEIGPALLLIPGDHQLSVYTCRIFVKWLPPEGANAMPLSRERRHDVLDLSKRARAVRRLQRRVSQPFDQKRGAGSGPWQNPYLRVLVLASYDDDGATDYFTAHHVMWHLDPGGAKA